MYESHTPRVYPVLMRLLGGSADDANDALQETWMRALAGMATFDWRSSFSTWLTGIAIRVALTQLRASRRWSDAWSVEAEIADTAPPDAVIVAATLEHALARLPAGYRAVLLLHDLEGFTHEEIGTQLGITAGTSKGQLFKARRAMRALLGEDANEERRA